LKQGTKAMDAIKNNISYFHGCPSFVSDIVTGLMNTSTYTVWLWIRCIYLLDEERKYRAFSNSEQGDRGGKVGYTTLKANNSSHQGNNPL
jgi:hypothetical protein